MSGNIGVLRGGGQYPFWFENLEYHDLTTGDFDPAVTYAAAAVQHHLGTYLNNGFGVKNATTNIGHIYAITWHQYEANDHTFLDIHTGLALVPIRIDLDGYDWCLTPIVKVLATTDQTYPSTVTAITIGWIL